MPSFDLSSCRVYRPRNCGDTCNLFILCQSAISSPSNSSPSVCNLLPAVQRLKLAMMMAIEQCNKLPSFHTMDKNQSNAICPFHMPFSSPLYRRNAYAPELAYLVGTSSGKDGPNADPISVIREHVVQNPDMPREADNSPRVTWLYFASDISKSVISISWITDQDLVMQSIRIVRDLKLLK